MRIRQEKPLSPIANKTGPDFGFIVAQVVVAPIENDMLPRIQERMKWLNFVDIAKGQ